MFEVEQAFGSDPALVDRDSWCGCLGGEGRGANGPAAGEVRVQFHSSGQRARTIHLAPEAHVPATTLCVLALNVTFTVA